MPFLRGEIVAALLAAAAAGAPGATADEAGRILKDDSYQKQLPAGRRGGAGAHGSAPACSAGGEAGEACGEPAAEAGAERGQGAGPHGPGDGRSPRDDAGRILGDRDFQKSLPQDAPPPDFHPIDLGWLGPIVKVLAYVALAVVVTLLVVWLATRLRGRAKDEQVESDSAPAPLEVPLDNAQQLARAGRFAEAIHALLLETLAALSRAARLAPSLTSREILARVALPIRAREALAGLVLAVEISRFGGAEASEGDYRACLDRFHAFLDTYHRGGARDEGATA